jgi:hypothetical protein
MAEVYDPQGMMRFATPGGTSEVPPPVSAAVPSRPDSTGQYLISFRHRDARDVVKDLQSVAGLRSAAFSSDYDETSEGLAAETGSPLLVFDRLRVAVVDADPEQAEAVSSAHAEIGVSRLEPERFVYAAGEPLAEDRYAQGVRDGAAMMMELYGRQQPSAPGSPPVPGVPGGTAGTPLGPLTPAFGTVPAFPQLTPGAAIGAHSWALDALGVTASSPTGRGVRLAVLDTGLDLAHPDLGSRPILMRSFVPGEDISDLIGHGTHCAGLACGPEAPVGTSRYGVAPNAELVVGKVLGPGVGAPMRRVFAGIDWAVYDADARIVSMSFATRAIPGEPYSQIFEDLALLVREDAQAVLVAAVGNHSERARGLRHAVGQPASSPSVLAVAALTRELTVADFSNASWGYAVGQVDIAAPGVNIPSAWPGSTQPYAEQSGTSMATPLVAGVLAMLLEIDPDASASEVTSELLRRAQRLPESSMDVGAGLVQAP